MSNSIVPLPKWRSMLVKTFDAHCNHPESMFFQVATIAVIEDTNELTVENRTIVFRGFAASDNTLLAITDNRSDKYEQWQQFPQSQICWYFSKTREQYRISNSVVLLGKDYKDSGFVDNKMRENVWHTLSENAKAQFLWPTPKKPIELKPMHIAVNENAIPDTFVVILFLPTAIDYINVLSKPQTRELHKLDKATGKWTYRKVNP